MIRFFLFIFFSLSVYLQVVAQTRIITGKVIGAEDQLPIAGVSVNVKGTKQGTVTNSNGTFSISAGTASTLSFSFVGCK